MSSSQTAIFLERIRKGQPVILQKPFNKCKKRGADDQAVSEEKKHKIAHWPPTKE